MDRIYCTLRWVTLHCALKASRLQINLTGYPSLRRIPRGRNSVEIFNRKSICLLFRFFKVYLFALQIFHSQHSQNLCWNHWNENWWDTKRKSISGPVVDIFMSLFGEEYVFNWSNEIQQHIQLGKGTEMTCIYFGMVARKNLIVYSVS